MANDKQDQLRELGIQRASATPPDGYLNLSDVAGGRFECEHVSPYTKCAANLDASVFVLLQDWCSEGGLSRLGEEKLALLDRYGRLPNLQANLNLDTLLRNCLNLTVEQTFATNLFPFIKQKGMSTRIPQKLLCKCALEFAVPQIQIVRPKLVIALGEQTYNAMRMAWFGKKRVQLGEAIESPLELGSTMVYAQAHTGYWGQLNRNKVANGQVDADWKRMAEDLNKAA